MTDMAALAEAVGCNRRTLERWRSEGAPMPKRREKTADWVARLRAWKRSRPKRTGPVFVEEPDQQQQGHDWDAENKRALALKRMHELQVVRGQYLSKERVVDEWARRAFAVSRKFLALPRQIAASVTASPEIRAQIESEADRLVREALLDYVRHGELTPTPPELQDLGEVTP